MVALQEVGSLGLAVFGVGGTTSRGGSAETEVTLLSLANNASLVGEQQVSQTISIKV